MTSSCVVEAIALMLSGDVCVMCGSGRLFGWWSPPGPRFPGVGPLE